MRAKREQWHYADKARVWVGKYRNSNNMPHWHYDCELLLVEQGELSLFCDKDSYVLKAGQAGFVDSGQVHQMHAATPDTVLTMAIFDYDIIRRIVNRFTLACSVLSSDYGLQAFFGELFEELTVRPPYYRAKTEALVAQKIIEIFRGEQTIACEAGAHTSEEFKRLLEEIDENYEFYDLAAAADFMKMNSTYFSSLFHKLAGMTFSQYLNYMKTSRAVELLQSRDDLSVAEVSTRCGFATIRNFNRIFKEFTGYTPKTLPRNFVMQESIICPDEDGTNPTLNECELLASTDDVTSKL